MVSQLSTKAEVEEELNSKFSGKRWEVETFEGKEVLIEVSTIRVRPRVNLGGLPEPDHIWTNNFRSEPSQTERARSILFNEWMTEVRFNIIDGKAEDLRPAGLNLRYASFVSSSAIALDEKKIVTRAVGISNEHEMHSNKLETRILYDGSQAEYTENVEKVVDNIRYIQDNMEDIGRNYLMNLYSPSDESWESEQMARDLVSYLFGEDVDFEYIELGVRELWNSSPGTETE